MTVNDQTSELTTERLLLRAYRMADADDVLAYATDADWKRFLPMVPHPYTVADAKEFLTRMGETDPPHRAEFAAEFEGHVIGGISLRFVRERVAEIGYSIARTHWGKGLVPEAALAVIDWGFTARQLTRVFAIADARNSASRRVMEKLGMQQEATLRQHDVDRDGQPCDQVTYGILRDEWSSGPRA